MIRYIVPALIAGLFAISPAAASPAATSGLQQLKPLAEGGVVEVQSRRAERRREMRRRAYRRGFRAGSRYRRAPRGWRRYYSRPWDWRTRGCIIVGPVWFCP